MAQPHADSDNATVRYIVADVARSIAFYVERLGFKLVLHAGAAFASVSRGKLTLLLSGPGSSGARPLPNGQQQEPGGSTRIVLRVEDLDAEITRLESAGVRFRNRQIESGPGGKQVQIEDPDSNPIELHQYS